MKKQRSDISILDNKLQSFCTMISAISKLCKQITQFHDELFIKGTGNSSFISIPTSVTLKYTVMYNCDHQNDEAVFQTVMSLNTYL
jgi:hypothetical protein